MINKYDIGDVVRVECSFTNPKNADAAIDPSVVKLTVKPPNAVGVVYTYGVDSEVIKDGVGEYHADINVTASGWWYYRWWSTGTGQAAEEGKFEVRVLNAQ